MKFKLNLPSKYLFLITIILIIISYSFMGYFLYKNFYQAIYLSGPIYLSGSDIALQRINTNLLNQVIAKIEEKNKGKEVNWNTVKNPFILYK